MRKVEAHIPISLWEQYEEWADQPGRSKIPMRQLLSALFKLFLALPERIKLAALSGDEEHLRKAILAERLVGDAEVEPQEPVQKPGRSRKSQFV